MSLQNTACVPSALRQVRSLFPRTLQRSVRGRSDAARSIERNAPKWYNTLNGNLY